MLFLLYVLLLVKVGTFGFKKSTASIFDDLTTLIMVVDLNRVILLLFVKVVDIITCYVICSSFARILTIRWTYDHFFT